MDILEGTYLKSLFDPYFEAPLTSWDKVAARVRKRSFKKNEIIKEEGKVEQNINVIISGSIGSFFWTDNNAKCVDLFYDNDFSCDFMSFITNESNSLFTMALEDTEVFSISQSEAENLYTDSLIGFQIVSAAAQSLFVHKQKQQMELMTMSAEDRYKKMMAEKPEMVQRTPAKHIASYLGIAPESMSRIRNKISPGA